MPRTRQRPGSGRRPQTKKSRLGLWTALAVLVLAAAYFGTLEASRPHVSGDRLRFNDFVDLVGRGQIIEARILDIDSYVTGQYRPDGTDGQELRRFNTPYLKANGSVDRMVDLLTGVPTTIDQQDHKRILGILGLLIPTLILVVLLVYLFLSYRQGTGLFGVRSAARKIHPDDVKVTFADVAGQDAAVTELREIKDFLSDPGRFAAVGATVPKGVLLYGPPGCGKTLLARALAGEAGASFFSISGSDFVEMYVGVGAARVRDLFEKARESTPALIFIDELDSIGRSRGRVGTVVAHSEQEQALNQILAEMDGFSPLEGLIVVAATNRPDVLDPALLRPGRFDRSLGLELPNEVDRLAILQLHAANKSLDPGADLDAVARRAIGMTGADLASVINEAALLAARARRTTIAQTELDQALKRVMEAPERQRRLSMRQRSIGKRFSNEARVTFADVAGVDDAIEELSDIQTYLAEPARYADLGAKVPRGILLAGPPGCGKTLLARAVAGEANAAFFSVAASEFVEIFVGQGAARVRELFAEARSVAPAIVFIDELDAIGTHRGGGFDGGERDQTVNQILVELDGFEAHSAVIVMAATNRPDMLDTALIRPGRFDRQVEISMPDRAGRRAILEVHARHKHLSPEVDLEAIAAITQGYSGADLANVLNEAALLAARRAVPVITPALVDEGVDRAALGVASRGTIMTEDERRLVAYHEAGHALVARALPGSPKPHKLTIVPRARSLGHCTLVDDAERHVSSKARMLDRMAGLLGGRVAEQLVLGDVSSGASNDLERANSLARTMVSEWGMSDRLGAQVFVEERNRWQVSRPWSEASARAIDAGVAGFLSKERPVKDVANSIRAAFRGEPLLEPAEVRRILKFLKRKRAEDTEARGRVERLTTRETQILQLMADGLSPDRVAERLGISRHTLRTHVQN
ncbi:MAG: AAA family ATPase, partial [Acidimicrobiales bacterium]